jgi:hypothetical protein
MRCDWLCSRPAVSASTTSVPRPGSVRPHLELLDRGGAKGIAGGEQHRVPFRVETPRQLADGRGLARAIDADDEDDRGVM